MFNEAMENPESIEQVHENTMADFASSTRNYRTVQYALSLPLGLVIIPVQDYLSREYLHGPFVRKEKSLSEVKNVKKLLLLIDFGRRITNSIIFALCVVKMYLVCADWRPHNKKLITDRHCFTHLYVLYYV